jgi:iron complex transport system ATP-binding protein
LDQHYRGQARSGEGLAVVGLSAGYGGADVISAVDVEVRAGEVAVLLGPNGAGKSTLLRAVAGLLPLRRGEVRIDGVDVSALDRRALARLVALVPQVVHDAIGFTVREVVAMGRSPHQGAWLTASEEDHRAVAHALDACGLVELADRRADQLSGGEAKRVAIARALAQGARVLLLDEAGAHLDIRHAEAMYALVQAEARSRRLACLAVMHDLNAAARWADQVVLLQAGKHIAAGPPEEVMTAPRLAEAFGAEMVVADVGGRPAFLPAGPGPSRSRPSGGRSL